MQSLVNQFALFSSQKTKEDEIPENRRNSICKYLAIHVETFFSEHGFLLGPGIWVLNVVLPMAEIEFLTDQGNVRC
jgi:hypothetical protein